MAKLGKKKQHELVNAKKHDKPCGEIRVDRFTVIKRHSFLKYLKGGLNLKFSVAIDFTASNKPPYDPTSLHYMEPNFFFNKDDIKLDNLNEYQKAIVSIGTVIEEYDSDKKWPVYGFGANLRGKEKDGLDKHCFPLSLDEDNIEVEGVEGLMKIYAESLNNVSLSGPTYFKSVISRAVKECEEVSEKNMTYNVLLIITDGVINDMADTIKIIIQASKKPLSIIIVGVGNEDFTPMRELDADEKLLRQNNHVASRDIVQFVPYKEFSRVGLRALAEETLKEVPTQIEDFFNNNKIAPTL